MLPTTSFGSCTAASGWASAGQVTTFRLSLPMRVPIEIVSRATTTSVTGCWPAALAASTSMFMDFRWR